MLSLLFQCGNTPSKLFIFKNQFCFDQHVGKTEAGNDDLGEKWT